MSFSSSIVFLVLSQHHDTIDNGNCITPASQSQIVFMFFSCFTIFPFHYPLSYTKPWNHESIGFHALKPQNWKSVVEILEHLINFLMANMVQIVDIIVHHLSDDAYVIFRVRSTNKVKLCRSCCSFRWVITEKASEDDCVKRMEL